MNNPLQIKKTLSVTATPEQVWDALINPEKTKMYMFGCKIESSWKVGSEVNWIGAHDGKLYVSGKLVKIEPLKRLAYTTFDPSSTYNDAPENHVLGEYCISEENGSTILEISQGDFSKVEDGEKRFKESDAAWDMALQGLKNLLESS